MSAVSDDCTYWISESLCMCVSALNIWLEYLSAPIITASSTLDVSTHRFTPSSTMPLSRPNFLITSRRFIASCHSTAAQHEQSCTAVLFRDRFKHETQVTLIVKVLLQSYDVLASEHQTQHVSGRCFGWSLSRAMVTAIVTRCAIKMTHS